MDEVVEKNVCFSPRSEIQAFKTVSNVVISSHNYIS